MRPCIRPICLGVHLDVKGGTTYPSVQEPVTLAVSACAVSSQVGYRFHRRGDASEGSKERNGLADAESSSEEFDGLVCAVGSKC